MNAHVRPAHLIPATEGRKSVRDVIASVCGEADAAQYRPSGNRPSLTALAEHDREQRVFRAISEGELYTLLPRHFGLVFGSKPRDTTCLSPQFPLSNCSQ